MRLAFAGTPEFAVPVLEALLEAGHDPVIIYSQPDRASGRGRRTMPSAVSACALERGLRLSRPGRMGGAEAAELRASGAATLVVVAFGQILPGDVLDATPLGGLNVHASLLPRWRGAAPIARAIEAGDRETGVCIMRMDPGLDTGPVLLRRTEPIRPEDTSGTLAARLADLGAKALVTSLSGLAAGSLKAEPQPVDGATYARKLGKDEARLDWTRPAAELERQVRAFHPVPVAWTEAGGERVRVHGAALAEGTGRPGQVLDSAAGIVVACGEAALRITRLQRPGGRPMAVDEVLRGWQPPARLGGVRRRA